MTEEVKLFSTCQGQPDFSLCSSLQKAHMQGIRFTKVFFVIHNIHLYRTTIPSITKQNHEQLIFLDHFSNYHVTPPY